MGFWSRFIGIDSTDPAQRVLPAPFEPFVSTGGIPVADPATPLEAWTLGERTQVERFWSTQPNVRKVVDFIARNVAGIPFHVFERVSDTERVRITEDELAALMRSPRPGVSAFRFWHSVLSDGLLYDRWCVLIESTNTGAQLLHIPSWRLNFKVDALRRVSAIRYWVGDSTREGDGWIDIDMERALFDHGYAPATAGLTPIQTLRDVLDESAEAVSYRRQVWENGGRIDQQVTRPKDADWSPEARERWINGFRDSYTGRGGAKAGGIPLMEDGMKLEPAGSRFSSRDALDLEGRRLNAVEVAAAFHIAPELVGAQQGNYSNVREYRQMLYRDSLGPYYQPIEGAINAQLVPRFAGERRLYVEANVEAKLRGSFEEQADVVAKATGAPWMTINEARALRNLPAVEGGDVPVQPLNLIYGGQMPSDAGTQNQTPKARGPRIKAAPTDPQKAKIAEVLGAFFGRQGKVVLSRIGAGEEWWDGKRWDSELADDLHRVMHTLAEVLGKVEAERLGYPDGYEPDATVNFLRAVAERYASNINETTKGQLDEQVDSEEPDPAHVFAVAADSRAEGAAVGIGAFVAGFATVEAAKQIRARDGVNVTKTWSSGTNPRAEHAAMDGQTVDIDSTFSNGMDWPGSGGDADDIGCNCSVTINIEET